MEGLTTCAARTHGAVVGVLGVATTVTDCSFEETLFLELFAEGVLNAPEASGSDGTFLSIGWECSVLSGRIGIETHFCRRGKRAEESREEIGHGDGHDNDQDWKEKVFGVKIQVD